MDRSIGSKQHGWVWVRRSVNLLGIGLLIGCGLLLDLPPDVCAQDINRVTLRVRSSQPGSEVLLNGRSAGMTDERGFWSRRLERTRYRILVRKDGYHDEEQTIDLIVDRTIQVTLRAKGHLLSIVTQPAGCDVIVNGETEGQTDEAGRWEKILEQGTHTIRVSKTDFVSLEKRLTLAEAAQIEFQLVPVSVDFIVVTEPSGTEVSLDGTLGQHEGRTPNDGQLIFSGVRAGTYQLRLAKERYLSLTEPVRVSPETPLVKRVLEPDPAWRPIEGIETAVKKGQWGTALAQFESLEPAQAGRETAFNALLKVFVADSVRLLSELGPSGISLEVREMEIRSRFFELAKTERPEDKLVATFSSLWKAKYHGAKLSEAIGSLSGTLPDGVEIDPAQVSYELGVIHAPFDTQKAESYFREAAKQNPKWDLPYLALARLHASRADQETDVRRKRDQFRAVAQEFDRVILLNPNSHLAFAERCLALIESGKVGDALKDGQKAVELEPESALANYAFGLALYRSSPKSHPEAVKHLEAALRLEKDDLSLDQNRLASQILNLLQRRQAPG